MKQVLLPNSNRSTSQIGFGCAFWSSISDLDAARILGAAYDAGIRHFDVAPYYLDGAAERYLGRFLSNRRDVSVATKYGLLSRTDEAFHSKLMRLMLKPVHRSMRAGVRWPFQSRLSAISRRKARYTAEELQASLRRSLTRLNLSYLDIFLFHEPDGDEFDSAGLLDTARNALAEGSLGAVGIGAEAAQVATVLKDGARSWDVVQYDWNAFAGRLPFTSIFQIIFWVAGRNFQELHKSLLRDERLIRYWSEGVGLDLYRPDNLRALLFKAALLANSDGITLIYSSNVAHIHQNVAIAEDSSLDQSAMKFLELAQAVGPTPAT